MTTTMHFGPEWMRAKPQTPARQQPPPSPQLQQTIPAHHQSTVSTYSSLVTSAVQEQEQHDESRPFRYTKEEMLRIYKEGGGKGGLGLEVERWEGIVHETGSEPASLREMDEAEKKLFAGPLNSEIRRRQPSDLVNVSSLPSDRSRATHVSGGGGPVRERFGSVMGRRKESTDQPALMPRKLSLSTTQGSSLASPREVLPSPRNRMGTFGSGFDGVLNNGDSWSRRRPSATLVGSTGTPVRPDAKDVESRRSDIKEEEVHVPLDGEDDKSRADQQLSSVSPDWPQTVSADDNQQPTPVLDSVVRDVADMNLGEPSSLDMNLQAMTATSAPVTGPSGLPDPASVEWSYLDPQGQVQGPFRADVMQKWFDEGYFTAELLMKRTHLDVEWIPVAALERRCNGGKVFLSQPPSISGPPGLTLPPESPQCYSPAHEHSTFSGYQPVPQRAVRSTTLDPSYLNNVSPSDSPSSSLGAARFGDGSPDPTVFSNIIGGSAYSGDANHGSRGLSARVQLQDPASNPRVPFNNRAPVRATSTDAFGSYNGGPPWSAGLGPLNQGFNANERHPFTDGYSGGTSSVIGPNVPVTPVHGFNQESFNDALYNDKHGLGGYHDPPLVKQAIEANGTALGNSLVNGFSGSQYSSPTQSHYSQPSASFPPSLHHQAVPPFGEALTQASVSPHVPHTSTSAVQPNSGTSPWPDPSPIHRTRTVDTSTTSSPVSAQAQAQQGFNWARSIQPPPQAVPKLKDPSPWLMASLGGTDDRWKEIPDSLSDAEQCSRLGGQGEGGVNAAVPPVSGEAPTLPIPQAPVDELPLASAAPTSASQPTPTSSEPQATSKPRRRSTAHDAHTSVAVQKSTPASLGNGPSPVPIISPPSSKSVWSTADEERKAKPTATMSLREIQEAEAKMAETRKTAEKERERARTSGAALVATSGSEDPQSFSASWGLPTSQAGARNIPPPKDTSTPAVPSVPVWTTAAATSTTRKSMKEIQEEEERRKKIVVKESVASAVTRRAYADTAFKTAPSTQVTGSSAWTTVGANGKAATGVAAPPRPAATMPATAAATGPPAVASRQNGAATRPATAVATSAPIKPVATPRVEDFPVTPSHDFLKWLSDSLKGLNSSVNLEEITSMLLSFPLDPDPSTVEIISDLIYANSTTLDGRRFASEYVSKRKADAATKRNATGAGGNGGKPVSIADVVKTQPKAVQQEWSFKVVNKKKKGGRS